MKLYLDENYKCHLEAAEGLREVETDAFDGKCKTFIKGCRYIPEGETWIREDGVAINGGVSPWEDYNILAAAQAQYEEMIAEQQDMQTALETLGVNVDG